MQCAHLSFSRGGHNHTGMDCTGLCESHLLSFVIFEESIRAWTTGYCFLLIQILNFSSQTWSWFCRSEPLPVWIKGGGMSYSTSFSYCGGDFCCFRLVRSCCPSFLWWRDLLKDSLTPASRMTNQLLPWIFLKTKSVKVQDFRHLDDFALLVLLRSAIFCKI